MNERQIVDVLAEEDNPYRDETFGQGQFGKACRYCGGDDWDGAVLHQEWCPWYWAREIRGREISGNIRAGS